MNLELGGIYFLNIYGEDVFRLDSIHEGCSGRRILKVTPLAAEDGMLGYSSFYEGSLIKQAQAGDLKRILPEELPLYLHLKLAPAFFETLKGEK